MKYLIISVVIVAAAFYFWQAAPGKDYSQELATKRAEVAAREEALKQVDAQIEQWRVEAESKICPETGRPGVFTLNDDPRPKLREEIAQLNKEITELEGKTKI